MIVFDFHDVGPTHLAAISFERTTYMLFPILPE